MQYYSENGMITYLDYTEALAAARNANKPLMVYFTGINCADSKKMERQVWSNSTIRLRLKNDFVVVSLYVDVQDIYLEQKDQYYSKALHKKIETVGDKNADLQVTKFGVNALPCYFFLDGNENKLVQDGYGYQPGVENFLSHLNKALTEYQIRKQ